MQSAPEQGQLMALLVELIGARRVLEIGCFTGYSALAMALALPPDGRLVTLDVNADWVELGRRAWREAGRRRPDRAPPRPGARQPRPAARGGRGRQLRPGLHRRRQEELRRLLRARLTLVRPGGLILLDNVLWGGAVADPADARPPDRGAARAQRQAPRRRAGQPVAAADRRRPDAGAQAPDLSAVADRSRSAPRRSAARGAPSRPRPGSARRR